MNEIMHLVGNRPQFIKLAPLYHELQNRGYKQYIVHSGQHYDASMSEIFFQELNIPKPNVNLQVGSGSHAEITGGVMLALERELQKQKPSLVILYGDTDTTLAGAVATVKLHIPIAHVEGGARTHNRDNPEECNRIVTDHLSNIIFCPDRSAMQSAEKEGLADRSYLTGDIMYDTFLSVRGQNNISHDEIILMTWHRQENTADKDRMRSILRFIQRLDGRIVCPLHPRTRKYLQEFGLWQEAVDIDNLEIIEPVGYIEMVSLMNRAKLIVTDSGGLSKESSYAGAKCLFMLGLDLWDDLVNDGWIVKVDPQEPSSVNAALAFANQARHIPEEERPKYYGDGHTAAKIVDLLERHSLI